MFQHYFSIPTLCSNSIALRVCCLISINFLWNLIKIRFYTRFTCSYFIFLCSAFFMCQYLVIFIYLWCFTFPRTKIVSVVIGKLFGYFRSYFFLLLCSVAIKTFSLIIHGNFVIINVNQHESKSAIIGKI